MTEGVGELRGSRERKENVRMRQRGEGVIRERKTGRGKQTGRHTDKQTVRQYRKGTAHSDGRVGIARHLST